MSFASIFRFVKGNSFGWRMNRCRQKPMKTTKHVISSVAALLGIIPNLIAAETVNSGYLSFDGGLTIQRNIGIKDSGEKVSFDPGLRLDFAVGFGSREPNSWGAEIEVGLLYNSTRPIATFDAER